MRVSATEVRELESAASVRISASGHLEISRMLRTAPRVATPTPGTISRFWRDSSIAGMLPISTAPEATSSAHREGTRKVRSKRS